MIGPIGVIDSGVGGLTVAKEIMRALPNESIIYLGDDARCPYGPRTTEEVASFTLEIAKALKYLNIKMLVIACNTATAAALPLVKEACPFPVIGVIDPGSRAALHASEQKKVVVLGTSGTVKSGAYHQAIHEKEASADVQALACPTFVPLVEEGLYKSEKAKEEVEKTLSVLDASTFDTAILGCTHYPLLEQHISEAFPAHVRVISSAEETARDVERVLKEKDLLSKDERATYQFYTTGDVKKFQAIVEDWLQIEKPQVERLDLQAVIQSKGKKLRFT